MKLEIEICFFCDPLNFKAEENLKRSEGGRAGLHHLLMGLRKPSNSVHKPRNLAASVGMTLL